MMVDYGLLVVMTLLGSFASLFLKKASESGDFVRMLMNWKLYTGAGLYLSSAVLNIFLLRFMDYSVVLPLTSITYVWTMILSYYFLKEKITGKKICGVGLIITGAVIVSL